MKKVFSYIMCVCLTALLTLGSLVAGNQVNSNVNNYKDCSFTYKMPYRELEKELLYARIIRYTADGKETTALLRDKGQLVTIVREFDRLKVDKSIHSTWSVIGRKLCGYSLEGYLALQSSPAWLSHIFWQRHWRDEVFSGATDISKPLL